MGSQSTSLATDALINKALSLRDDSLSRITPTLPLTRLPQTLPQNVRDLPNHILDEEEIEITSLEANEIIHAIRVKKYSCVTVCKAFLRRAALAQSLVFTSPLSLPIIPLIITLIRSTVLQRCFLRLL